MNISYAKADNYRIFGSNFAKNVSFTPILRVYVYVKQILYHQMKAVVVIHTRNCQQIYLREDNSRLLGYT